MYRPGFFREFSTFLLETLSAGGVHYGAQISIFENGGNCIEMEGKSYPRLVREQCPPCGRQDSTIKQHKRHRWPLVVVFTRGGGFASPSANCVPWPMDAQTHHSIVAIYRDWTSAGWLVVGVGLNIEPNVHSIFIRYVNIPCQNGRKYCPCIEPCIP